LGCGGELLSKVGTWNIYRLEKTTLTSLEPKIRTDITATNHNNILEHVGKSFEVIRLDIH